MCDMVDFVKLGLLRGLKPNSFSLLHMNANRKDIRICCRKCKDNIGSNICLIEDKLLQALKILLKNYKIKLTNNDNSNIENLLIIHQNSLLNYKTTLAKRKLQLNKTYDLLEQGIYSKEKFVERSNLLKQQIKELNHTIEELKNEKKNILKIKNNKEILVPKIQNVIDCYYQTDNIKIKNELLKSVLEKVEYLKITPKSKENFNLKLYPKLY